MTKLNPCPNCGSEPQLIESSGFFLAGCEVCYDLTQVCSKSASGAINAWNAATSDGTTAQSGKTLRDEFAMAAMSGMLQIEGLTYKEVADGVYQLADAILKERSK